MTTWQGLNAEEIASIPRDEYCFQKIERILRERNELKELSDEEIIEIGNAVVNLIDSNEGWIEFAKAILKKASEK
jgi:tellurite resistance protein